MKKLFILTVVVTSVLLSSKIASAQDFKIVNSSRSNLELSLTIDEFSLENSRHAGIEGQNIVLSGIFLPNEAGMPDLPVISRYVAIPRGSHVSLNVIRQVTETISDVNLMPAPVLPLDNDKSTMVYARNEKVYSTDAFFPSNPIITSEPMKIRDVDVAIVSVTPFQYNPVTKELIVTRNLDLEVRFEDGDGIFGGDPRYRSPAWDHIIRDMVINENILPDANYQQFIKNAVGRGDYGCEYLIISPDNDNFLHLADSIKKFRTEQGILTEVVRVSECGGNNENAIRNYIINAYYNWDIPVSAVLLLGDYNTNGAYGIVSPFMYNHPENNPYISDNRYADVDDDHLPDVVMGRITGRTYNELSRMINKDLQYERTPPTDPDFYDKPMTAMGFQEERWFQLCSEIVNGFWEHGLGKHPVRANAIYDGTPGDVWSSATNTNTIINYFGPNGMNYIPETMSHLNQWYATANTINNAINSGAFMVQHRDHGAETLWGEPYYDTYYIGQLNNTNLPFVMSCNCLTGKFNYGGANGTCFAEAFHRSQHGALGLIAATEVSYSYVNDVYVWGAYDNMWPEFMPNYGTEHPTDFILPAYGNVSGKYFLEQSSWTGNSVKEITYYLFHHHGDVYMNIYSEVPQNLNVTMSSELTQGETHVQLAATAGATICITSNGKIIALETATGQPQTIEIEPQIIGNDVIVTITKQNFRRYSQRLNITPNNGPYLIINNIQINNFDNDGFIDYNLLASLNVALCNIGIANIQNVTAQLTSDSPYVEILSSSATYESINVNETVNKNNAFSILISDDVPDKTRIKFQLTMSNGTHTNTDAFTLVVRAPVLEVTKLHIKDANGNLTERLFAGETSQITYTIRNQGHASSNTLTNELFFDFPFIVYEASVLNTTGIGVNDSIDVTFHVSVPNTSPSSALFDGTMTVTSNGYNAFFQSTIPLGYIIEGFENEEFNSQCQWSNTGKPWIKDSTDPYEGSYCLTSTSTSASPSNFALGYECETEDVMSFYYKGSVNANDMFSFYVNGQKHDLTGNSWQYFELPLSPQRYVFQWVFSRRSNASVGSASLDLIKLPPKHIDITSVEENYIDKEISVSVYPNPGSSNLNIITSGNSVTKLQLFDFQGRLVLEKEISDEVTTINTEHLPTGLYFWKVGKDTGKWIKSN